MRPSDELVAATKKAIRPQMAGAIKQLEEMGGDGEAWMERIARAALTPIPDAARLADAIVEFLKNEAHETGDYLAQKFEFETDEPIPHRWGFDGEIDAMKLANHIIETGL